MQKAIFLFTLFVVCTQCKAQTIAIIPQPASLQVNKGSFTITPKTVITVDDAEDHKAADFFNQYLQEYYGFQLNVGKQQANNVIQLTTRKFIKAPDHDAYALYATASGVRIEGDTYAGTFYGIQTLIQLLPVYSGKQPTNHNLTVPQVIIQDTPRFKYRGMHLDVGRHFFPISFIKKYIDYIALHKMNYFHWHLTDDQGWRIEIKKYPKLTEVGSCRNGTIIGRYPGTGNDSIRYCGFYTQNEIKDMVQYAADRHITIIPEIDMPGHSSAALASYPWLGCPGTGPYKVQETWGVFNDVYCAGKDSTFLFLENVLDEVMALFPSPYIHIGGDEAPKTNWKNCPLCQQRMKDEGLKNENELQSYFIRRIENYVNSKGRSIIGWDEILEGGLAPNATVMSWRGEKGGIAAATQNHDVIMTPEAYVYLDQAQKLKEDSVTIGRYLPVEKVYGYEPVPDGLTTGQAQHVLGAQGNVWTEYMKFPSKVEYMIFPRMSALSEVLWSPKNKRNWMDFEKRLQVQMKRYQMWGAHFSTAYYDINATLEPAAGNRGVNIKLQTNDSGGKIVYKTDGGNFIPYTKPITVLKDEVIKAVKKSKLPDTLTLNINANKATGKIITLLNQPIQGYQGNGAFTLVDGLINERGLERSSELLGFKGVNTQAVIDLNSMQTISKVVVHTLSSGGSRIYPVHAIEVFGSRDGKSFKAIGSSENYTSQSALKGKLTYSFPETSTRFVKVVVQPLSVIPEGRAGAGEHPLYFLDEIEIN